jgi:hypothetical protein
MLKDDDLEIPAALRRPAPPPTAPVGNGDKQPEAKATTPAKDAPKPEAQQASKPKAPARAKPAPRKAKAPAKAKARAKAKAPIPMGREGLVAVTDIAKDYGLVPREARALLRAAKLKKPAVGWAYVKDDAALKRVREVLKAGRGK